MTFAPVRAATHIRGAAFHVRKWDKDTGKLQITSPLPVVPVAGDMFRIFAGGKTASSQEVLAMKVSGKQPEVDNVAGTNITGITIKKASAMLGTGTLELRYEYTNRVLKLRMNNGSGYTDSTRFQFVRSRGSLSLMIFYVCCGNKQRTGSMPFPVIIYRNTYCVGTRTKKNSLR